MVHFRLKKDYLLLLSTVLILCNCGDGGKVIEKEVYFESADETLYFRREIYGLTGENDRIYISNKKTAVKNSENSYPTFAGFFYKKEGDTLHVFVREKVTLNFKSKVFIKQHVLDNKEMNNLFEHHSELGIKTFR